MHTISLCSKINRWWIFKKCKHIWQVFFYISSRIHVYLSMQWITGDDLRCFILLEERKHLQTSYITYSCQSEHEGGTRQSGDQTAGTKVTEYSSRGRGVVLSEQSVSHVSHVSEVIVSTKTWDITKS